MSSVAVARRNARPIRICFVVRWFFAIVLSLIALVPSWWMFNVVFSDAGSALSLGRGLYPTSLSGGIANISGVLADGLFLRAFVNSIIYSGLTAVLVLAFASAAAYEFAHYDFPAPGDLPDLPDGTDAAAGRDRYSHPAYRRRLCWLNTFGRRIAVHRLGLCFVFSHRVYRRDPARIVRGGTLRRCNAFRHPMVRASPDGTK